MCDFCVKPTQILNSAFYDYQKFIDKCNNQNNNIEETDKTILFNGINSNNNIDLAKQDYVKQERQQKMATDILERDLKKNEESQSTEVKSKEGFEIDQNGIHNFKINIDIKMIVIIILIIGIIYVYSLYLTTRSKMKYYKKILKFKEKKEM